MGLFSTFFGGNSNKTEFDNIAKTQRISDEAISAFIQKDVEKNGEIIRNAAKKGNFDCQVFVSQVALASFMQFKDIRFGKDFEYYAELAAQQGDLNSQYNLAQYYLNKIENVTTNKAFSNDEISILENALHWYDQASLNGWNDENNIITHLSEILSLRKEVSSDMWTEKLWEWADRYDIADEILPRNKEDLVGLKWLNLGGKGLKEIPIEIKNLSNLSILWLDDNQLNKLPTEIMNLTNLTKLGLTKNKLRELPEEIIKLNNLTELYLYENPNLILTSKHEKWIQKLKDSGAEIYIDTTDNVNNMPLLTDNTQIEMYNRVREFRKASNDFSSEPTQQNQKNMITRLIPLMDTGREVEEWLSSNDVILEAEYIVSAFYLVNIADTQLKNPDDLSSMVIQNTFATIVVLGLGNSSFTPENVTSSSIKKVRHAIKWLTSHPIE